MNMPRLETLRAKIGATILDVFRPGWASEVDLESLDLEDCKACVLGQLFGGFDVGAEKLFAMRHTEDGLPGGVADASIAAGFSLPIGGIWQGLIKYSNLTNAWKREIAKRV
jgi:hypothetical protein